MLHPHLIGRPLWGHRLSHRRLQTRQPSPLPRQHRRRQHCALPRAVDDGTPQHIAEGESEATDAPLLDDDDDEDDVREDDGIDVRDDVDDQAMLDMPVVVAAGTVADS